ncbi:MAG: hypothetical protein R3234_09360 [Thermoanaerobaculia bacterium]|nr:hypothetical protein [Thermoanaerobaculia bacterium]
MPELLHSLAELARSLRGPLNFLQREAEELYRLVPDIAAQLPTPQRIYLADESATPLLGFPVLQTPGSKQLSEALEAYIKSEEEAQSRILLRQSYDTSIHREAWERYRGLLRRATENVTVSSYGRKFPDVFWLHHSLDLARLLKETPRRVSRFDSRLGRTRGGQLKYEVFFKYLDRILSLTYDQVDHLASDTEEHEQELFPALLTRMRDNVLLLTEDHISPDLGELSAYFQDHLRIDGQDLRYRLAKLREWHRHRWRTDSRLRAAARDLLGVESVEEPRDLFHHRGYIRFVSTWEDYDPDRFLSKDKLLVWEKLLLKLKEFELFHGLRRLIVPLFLEDGKMFFRERSLNRTWIGPSLTQVSNATRPMDFMAPWVVDPLVSRFGLIYDITDFSQTVTHLRRAGTELQDRSFRQMFRFQRKINRLGTSYRLKLEKYLGDGAFFSAREAWRMVIVALQVQRVYREALQEGFPFDRGLRIALNHGQYRLLPIQGANPGEPQRYEFFGHGVVELTRLTTGKSMREIEEIKIFLVNLGYPEHVVHKFFAPLATKGDMDLVDKEEEGRRFHAYINRNGKLINEGIVATDDYVRELDKEKKFKLLHRVRSRGRSYIGFSLETHEGRIYAGIRKLGIASLKGLEPLPVYELVDGTRWDGSSLEELEETNLLSAIEREYAETVTRASS